MGGSFLVWGLGILAPIYVLLASFSSSPSFRPRRRISALWWHSFSVQTDSNTRGRTTSTGALQYHCVGQAFQGSALPLLTRPPCPLVREFGGNLQRHLARVQKVVFSLSCTSLSFLELLMQGCSQRHTLELRWLISCEYILA